MTPDQYQAAQWNAAIAQHLIRTAWPIDLQKLSDDVKGWTGRGHMRSCTLGLRRGPSDKFAAGCPTKGTTSLMANMAGGSLPAVFSLPPLRVLGCGEPDLPTGSSHLQEPAS